MADRDELAIVRELRSRTARCPTQRMGQGELVRFTVVADHIASSPPNNVYAAPPGMFTPISRVAVTSSLFAPSNAT